MTIPFTSYGILCPSPVSILSMPFYLSVCVCLWLSHFEVFFYVFLFSFLFLHFNTVFILHHAIFYTNMNWWRLNQSMCVVVYQWMPANAIQMRATNSNDAKKVNSIIKQKHTNTVNIHVWQDKANNSAYVYVWVDVYGSTKLFYRLLWHA